MLNYNDNNFDSCVIAAEQHQATAACSQLPFFYYSPHFRMFFLRAALPFLVTMATFLRLKLLLQNVYYLMFVTLFKNLQVC